jgi:hypothetical protein
LRNDPEELQERPERTSAFYLARYRFYAGLLLFVVVAGVPMLAVPGLRGRLFGRVAQLRTAVAGKSNTLPVSAAVGQNTLPFPAQYERPVVPKPQLPQFPPIPGLLDLTQKQAPAGPARPTPRPAPVRTESIPTTEPAPPTVTARAPEATAAAQETTASDDPVYRQGPPETDAYNILLGASATVRGIADGTYAPLRLKTWAAARRDEDTYWVQLTLMPSAGGAAGEYIWQVKMTSREATPLNFNARTLPR